MPDSPARRLPLVHPLGLPPVGPRFVDALQAAGVASLCRGAPTTLQVNVGKRCNQACHHCHVEAGPLRSEIMDPRTMARVLELLAASSAVDTVDVTGGAPELNPGFRSLVDAATTAGRTVIDRCNLTVLLEPGQEGTARFLADRGVRIVASLPCYTAANVDEQRGRGVFERSLWILRRLNEEGYGHPRTGLVLDLVYNPGGAFLPPDREDLEADYRRRLAGEHGVVFNELLTLTNMPIRRFADWLERRGETVAYMELLANAFNPATVNGLMCRSLVSVGYDGRLYDCDFNQMLDLPVPGAGGLTIWDIESLDELEGRPIATGRHCFGCTAGVGSSCGGALV